jgi:tetratricopeptide (TPR) repeat protein
VAALLGALAWRFRRRTVPRARLALGALACDADAAEPRRWGGWIPAGLIAALVLSRLAAGHAAPAVSAERLQEYASRAYQEERYGAAADYLRSALAAGPDPELRRSLLALRAESLSRAGRPEDALRDWRALLEDQSSGPYAAQALFGVISAAPGTAEAVEAAERLQRHYPESPWAARARKEYTGGVKANAVSHP